MGQQEVTFGGLLLLVSVATTCVYESALVQSIKSFEEGRSVVKELLKPQVEERHEGQLIHFSGLITTNATLKQKSRDVDEIGVRQSPFVMDPVFGIAAKGVRLYRRVEMLQWVETSHTSTSSTPEDEDQRFDTDRERIYMYDLQWREGHIDSSAFDDISHRNPPIEAWTYKSLVIQGTDLVVGEFSLSEELLDQIQRRDAVPLDAAKRRLMANLLDQQHGEEWNEKMVANGTVEKDFFYFRNEIRKLVVGDQRVYFEVTPNYPVTVCAKQRGNKVERYTTSAGDSLLLLEDGIMTADELFDLKSYSKVQKIRFFRLFATVLGFMGFLVLRNPLIERFRPLVTIQQHLLAGSMGAALTFSVVGAHWLLYRPLWTMALTLCGWTPLIVLFLLFLNKDERKSQ
ncbi:hypothetical protein CCR75_006107 [Bremia lactucae]|uniref:Transmembrane protein 43 n=1 Tax=Bremia lactucae TaxID=4779 RepID=A0A976NYV2_BRELC|nr:hypothetical protein CCR75_006107 [Bremia lactucae]